MDGVDAFESEFPLISMIKADNFIQKLAASIIAKFIETFLKLDEKAGNFVIVSR